MRFVPAATVRVTAMARVPHDVLVLLARMLCAILIGVALARPTLTPRRRIVARIVMADVSRAVGNIAQVRDSARAVLGRGDVLVVFDSAARIVRGEATDSASHLERTLRAGHLSAALIAALRAASAMRDEADSVELVLVSPLAASEIDGATSAIRGLWPGRLHLVRVPRAPDSLAARAGLVVQGAPDDPLLVAALAAGIAPGDGTVRVVRGTATAADSAWVAGGRRALLRWPARNAPPGWVARARVDTVLAVIAGEVALVFPVERRWMLDPTLRPSRILARWVDGEPAAVERMVGAGCLRDVAIPVPARGDLVLRPSFQRFLRTLAVPCGAETSGPSLDDAQVGQLMGTGRLAARGAIRAPDTVATPLVPWLLGAALVVALLEVLIRRGAGPERET